MGRRDIRLPRFVWVRPAAQVVLSAAPNAAAGNRCQQFMRVLQIAQFVLLENGTTRPNHTQLIVVAAVTAILGCGRKLKISLLKIGTTRPNHTQLIAVTAVSDMFGCGIQPKILGKKMVSKTIFFPRK